MQPPTKIQALYLGVLLPYIAVVVFFWRHQGQPQPTWLIYLGVPCVLAIVLGSLMIRRAHVRSTEKQKGFVAEATFPKSVWLVVNVGLIALSARQGYMSVGPEQLRHVNPDAVLCSLLLVILPLFVWGTVGYSVRQWKVEKLRRPTFDRNPLNWWFDPLQALFITTCNMAAMAVGGLLRGATGSVAFWMVASYFCFFVGLVVGQILVYRIYRERIVAA